MMLANKTRPLSIAIALLILGATGCSTQQSFNFSEEEIWRIEEELHNNLADANHDAVLSIYHDDFLGWPVTAAHPLRKLDLRDTLQKDFPEPRNVDFEIERGGIQLKENVAIAQFTLLTKSTSDENEEVGQSVRVTHTWLRETDGWKILGGMSYQIN